MKYYENYNQFFPDKFDNIALEMRLYWEFPWVPWVPLDSYGNGNR